MRQMLSVFPHESAQRNDAGHFNRCICHLQNDRVILKTCSYMYTLHSRFRNSCQLFASHDQRDCVSNHRRLDCLLSRLFRHRSKKASKRRVTGLGTGGTGFTPVDSPHKRPVTRKMFPFDDVIMLGVFEHFRSVSIILQFIFKPN